MVLHVLIHMIVLKLVLEPSYTGAKTHSILLYIYCSYRQILDWTQRYKIVIDAH